MNISFAAFLFNILAFTLLCSTLGRLYKHRDKDRVAITFVVIAALLTLATAVATWLAAKQ